MRKFLVFLVTWLTMGSVKVEGKRSLRDSGRAGYYGPRWFGEIPYYGPSQDPCSAWCLQDYSGVTKHIELLSEKGYSWYLSQFSDLYWFRQWYLQDYRGDLDPNRVLNVMDHNVVPVYWMGYTGDSINIAIVGDSIDATHPDLEGSIETRLCYGSVEKQQLLAHPQKTLKATLKASDEERLLPQASEAPAETRVIKVKTQAEQKIPVTPPKQKIPVTPPKQKIPVTLLEQKIPVITPEQKIPVTTPKQKIPVITTEQKIPVTTPEQKPADLNRGKHYWNRIRDGLLPNKNAPKGKTAENPEALPEDRTITKTKEPVTMTFQKSVEGPKALPDNDQTSEEKDASGFIQVEGFAETSKAAVPPFEKREAPKDPPGLLCKNKRPRRPPYWGEGTRAAGVIAMTPSNGHCGVGIAYGAKVAGVDTMKRCSPDLELSRALTHELREFDIYVNLWGPLDDGAAMKHMGYLVDQALQLGTSQGRVGKGVLYLVGAGDGKQRFKDNCGADDMVNSLHTVAIASASQRGKVTPNSESCSAIMATAYSSGSPGDEALLTTDPNGECTAYFGGTTGSASVAAGILALLLQANPNLNYRDVMHLIALTSEVAPLADNPDTWNRNKAGFWVSSDFGFGLLNAKNLVDSGLNWPGVGPMHSCVENKFFEKPLRLGTGVQAVFEHKTSGCENVPKQKVTFIEHVEVKPLIWYLYRGAIHISIRSPGKHGLETTLIEPRPHDHTKGGYATRWSFQSVQNWGEDPSGIWKITISVKLNPSIITRTLDKLFQTFGVSKPKECGSFNHGCFYGFSLTFHGLPNMPPSSVYKLPRSYSSFRLANGQTSEDPLP